MAQPKTQQTRKRPGSATAPGRRKSCLFCKDKVEEVDYKNLNQLRRYISEKGKIRNRRITGACRRHQRQVAVAVKRAREMALLPYVEQGELYKQYRFDEPWDSRSNRKVLEKMPDVYRVPGAGGDPTHSSYFVLTGPDTVFADTKGTQIGQVIDGTSNTIMDVEAKRAIPWTKPEDIPYEAAKPLSELGGYFPGGFDVGFGDGSVRFIKSSINEAVLRALITKAGGEVIGSDSF